MRYIRQFTRKQERNQTKTLEQQKHDLDLARKVLTAVTAFSFIGNPFAAMASTVTRVPDAAGGEIKFDKNVANIYAEQMKGDTAVNRFQDFKIDAGDIANMYFQSTALQGTDTWAKNLVNFVNNRIDVAGTVNAIKENKIGGNLFFLSKDGMAVTGSGVINAGSLTVLTPTLDAMKEFQELKNIEQIVTAPSEIALNKTGTITIAGQVNTLGDIRMYAGNKIEVTKSGLLQTNGAATPAAVFESAVNVKDTDGKDKYIEWGGLTAEEIGNGDIVLSAKNTESGGSAFIDVAGSLSGHDVNVSAVSDVAYSSDDEGEAKLSADASWGDVTGQIIETIDDKLDTAGVELADVSGSASVNIADGAHINAANNVTIAAESTVTVEAGGAPEASADGDHGGLMPVVGVVVANAENNASVTMNGEVNAGNDADIHASAETSLTVNAADASEPEEGEEESGTEGAASWSHTAVAVVNNKTNTSVTMNGATVNAGGAANIQSNVTNSLDISAETSAPGESSMATSVAVVDSQGGASVKMQDSKITGSSVTIAAENTVDGNAIAVNNGIGLPEEEPAEGGDEGKEEGGSSIVDTGKDIASSIMAGDSLTDAISGNLTDKISEALGGGSESGGSGSGSTAQNSIVQKLGSLLDLGASVAVVNEENTANVDISGANTVITATGTPTEETPTLGKVDIHANTIVDDTAMFVTGTANKQTSSAKKPGAGVSGSTGSANVIADAAVLVSDIDNKAAVSVNNAAISGANVDITSTAQMQYRLRGMVEDLRSSLEELAAALGSGWTDGNQAASDIKTLMDAVDAYLQDDESDMSPEGLAAFAAGLEDKIAAAQDSVTAVAGDAQDAKGAAESLKENLEAFKDTDNYINYSVHTESSDQLENQANGGKAGSSFELGIAGSVNVTDVQNAAATAVGGTTSIKTSGAATVTSGAQTETVSVTGNATSVLGNPSKKPAGSQQGNKSTSVGVGGSVAVQDITGSSAVLVGGGVAIGGKEADGAAKAITIAANNVMGQQGIVYGAGEAGTAGIEGMVNLMNGGSDSVVSIDKSASLAADAVNLTADNTTMITSIAGGSTLGSNQTAAAVGAGLGMVNYDVNNMVVVGDGAADSQATEEEKAAAAKRSEGKKLAEKIASEAGASVEAATAEGQGSITAHELNVTADTKGMIVNVAVEAAAITGKGNKNKQQNSALGNLNNLSGENKANEIIGDGGKVNEGLKNSDTAASSKEINEVASSGDKTVAQNPEKTGTDSGAANALTAEGGDTTQPKAGESVNGKITNSGDSTASSVHVAGAGSVAINLLGGETGAFVDNVNIQMQKDGSGKDGTVKVGAADSLLDGALAGAAAINWMKKGGTAAAGASGSSSTSVSIGGAAGVSVLDRGVSSVISNSKITDAGTIKNKAEKSGAEIATGLGLAVAKGQSQGTNVAVSAAVSYNEADSEIHALMIDNAVSRTDDGTTDITNTAYNSDLQITGGVSASVTTGGKTGVGVGGTVVISDLANDLQSGIIGGMYKNINNMNVDAAVATTQINAAVAGAVSTDSKGFGFTGGVSYNKVDNRNQAYIKGDAEVTAAGEVNVKAGDTAKGASDYAQYVEDRGLDTTGKTSVDDKGIADTGAEFTIADKGEDSNEENETSSFSGMSENDGSTIVNVAASVAASAGGAAGGVAVNVSDVDNSMSATISDATITAGSVTGEADTNTRIVSVAAGVGASTGKFGGAGSISWDTLSNDNTVAIDGSTIKAGSITGQALNKANIVNVAGQISAGGTAGVGLALAYNKMDNTTGVYVNGGTLASKDITLNAASQSEITAITAGVSGAGTAAVNGTVAVNRGSNSTEAIIGNDDKTVTITGAKDIDVTASDDSKNNTVAGGITGAGTVAVGGGVAYSDIGGSDKAAQQTRAEINHANITTAEAGKISAMATDTSELLTIAAGIGVGGTAAVQGAAATALVNKNVSASMTGTSIDGLSGTDAQGSGVADVSVSAESDSDITTSADVIAGSGTAAVGAGVAVNRIIQQTNAAINGGMMQVGDLTVKANGTPSITNIGIGASAAATAGVTGSVAVNNIQNDVTAHIGGGADITANNNVGVVATSDESIANYAGSASIAGTGAAVGASVSVNQISGTTSAMVGDDGTETKITALGEGDGLKTNTVIADGEIHDALISDDTVDMNSHINRGKETRNGLIVDASSTRDLKSFLINAGVGGIGAAVNGTVNVNQIKGATHAGITDTVVNGGSKGAASAGNVYVHAGDYTNSSGFVGSASVAGIGAGVGLGSDTNTVSRDVSAVVDDSDVKAQAFDIDADSKQGVSSFVVGAAVAGVGAGVTGVVTVTELENATKAALTDTDVSSASLNVSASHTGIVNAGNVGAGVAGVGAAAGLAIGVLKDESVTETVVGAVDDTKRADIDTTGNVTISAENTTDVAPTISATGVAGAGTGVAGATSVNNLASTVRTNIDTADIYAGGSLAASAKNTINVEAYMGSQAGGAGGFGAGVTVNTIDSAVQMKVGNSALAASGNIDISAEEERNITQTATNVSAGGAAIGANIAVTTVGQAVSDKDTRGEIDRVNTNANAGNDLLGNASQALDAAGIDDVSMGSDVAGIGGTRADGETAGITVDLTDSTFDAGGDFKAQAIEKDNIEMTLGSGTAGAVAVNAGVGILNVERNVGVNMTGGSVSAKDIAIGSTIMDGIGVEAGKAGTQLNVYQGSGGIYAGNAAVGLVSTSGVSQIDITGTKLAGNSIAIVAQDMSTTGIQAVAAANGLGALGALVAKASNDSDISVSLTGAEVDAEEDVNIRSEKANTVTAEAVNEAGGLVGGAGMGATVTDTGSSKITIENAKLKAGNTLGIDAETRSALTANIVSAAGGWFAGGSVSVAQVNAGTADDRLTTAVELKGVNTFEAADVNMSAKSKVEQNIDMKALAISGYGSAQGNVTETGAYTDTKITQEGADVFKGSSEGSTANVSFDADNTVSQTVKTSGVSAAELFATGTNISTTTSDLRTNIALVGSGEGSRIGDFKADAGSYASISNHVNGDGGAIADISPWAAHANNTYKADTDVTIGGNWNTSGSFMAQALNGMDIDVSSEATRAAVVGGSGTWLHNTIDNTANVTIDNANITTDGAQRYIAQNQVDYVGEIDGSGYGGVNVNATDYEDDLDFTAGVDIKNSALTGAGDEGSITAFASTEGTIHSKNGLKSAGVIPVALASSAHGITYNNSVNVTDSMLTTSKKDQDITLAASDDTVVDLEAIADTQGGAVGAASASLTNNMVRQNTVKIGDGSEIESANDVNLYSGADADGRNSSLKINVIADAYNKTIIPVYTAPTLDNSMKQENHVEAGGEVNSVRNINAKANKGNTVLVKSAKEYNNYTGTNGNGSIASTADGTINEESDEKHDNKINVSGQYTAGIHDKLEINISGSTETTEENGVNYDQIKVDITEGAEWFNPEGKDPKDLLDVKTLELENTLLAQYTALQNALNDYKPGSKEYKNLSAEMDKLIEQMKELNFVDMKYEEGKGWYKTNTPASNVTVQGIALPDILVSGGNINMESDSLTSTNNAVLTAKGSPEITINNSSDLYLEIHDLAIVGKGGEISFNGQDLTDTNKGNYQGAWTSISPTDELPTINITSTSASSFSNNPLAQPDISVVGNLSNTEGKICVTNINHNILIGENGNVSAKNVFLTAESGSVSQTSKTGIFNVAGDPISQYQFSDKVATQVQEYLNKILLDDDPENDKLNFNSYDEYLKWLVSKVGVDPDDLGINSETATKNEVIDESAGILAGNNVYINALNVNINGLVQAGYGNYSSTLTEEANDRIKEITQNWNHTPLLDSDVIGQEKYLVNAGGKRWNDETKVWDYEVGIYYNPATQKLLVDKVSPDGGQIYINGAVSSTGSNGRLMAMDGAADIQIDTTVVKGDAVQGIVMNEIANKNIEGLISITDMNKTTDSKGNAVDGLVTEYKNGSWREYEYGTSIIDRPEFINVDNDSNSNVEYTYQPESGLRYEYTGGYKAGEENHYSYKDYFIAWGWIDYSTSSEELDKIAQEGKADVETSTTNGDELANGVYIGKGTTGGDNSKDWYITGSAQRGEEVPVGKPTDHKEWGMHEDDSKKDPDWVGKMFGYGSIVYQWITENTTSTTTTSSIKADKPITIGFVGGKANEGKIDIRGNQNIELAGNISNAEVNGEGKGYVSISSGTGSIIAGSNANILSDDVRLDAATGIDVTHSAIGDAAHVALSTDSGDIRFESYHGDITIEHAVTGGAEPITAETGSVYLEAAGNILDGHTSGDYAVKGQRIDLVSKTGSIGTKDKALTILGGSELYSSDTMASSVNASAAGDIVLTQTSGNMRLGTIESTNGDAVLTVTNGSFVDAHPSENSSSSSAQDKIDRWIESGLIDTEDKANESTNAADKAKAERVEALTNRANSLAGGDEAKVESYWGAADAFYNDEGVKLAKETYLKAVTEAGGDEAKINAAYEQYQKDYQNAKTKYFENKGFSDGEQDLITSYAEVSNSDNYGWSKNELLYAIQESVLNPEKGDVQVVDIPNVTANNITLEASKGIGIDAEAEYIEFDELNDPEKLQILAGAEAGDITWGEDKITVSQQQAITVKVQKDDGIVNVTGKDNVYVAGVQGTKLNVTDVKTDGNIRLQGDAGVNVEGTLTGKDLTIAGGTGDIGSTTDTYVDTAITGVLSANAAGSVSIRQQGDLNIRYVVAGKDANLIASDSILMYTTEGTTVQSRINVGNILTMTAETGSIGSNETAIRILDNGVVVNADAVGGIWLSGESGQESTGNLVIGSIKGESFDLTSVSDVSLGRKGTEEDEAITGSITTKPGDASITAVNVDLADGSVNTNGHDFNVTAYDGNITQSAESEGLKADHVNLSSTGSQLLWSENNQIKSVTVKGLTDGSLTGNVEIHSAADSFGVQFGDKNGDTATGITVNDGSIYIHHDGSANGALDVTGSAMTQKSAGSKESADISFRSEQSAIHIDGAMTAGDNFYASTDSGAITVTGDVKADDDVTATTQSGSITVNGAVWSGTDTIFQAGGTEDAAGDITVNGAVHADRAVTAETTVGNIFFGGTTEAGTGITFTSNAGDISTTGSLTTAIGDVSAKTGSGAITLGGAVSATIGNVIAHSDAGAIEIKNNVMAGTDIDLNSGETGGISVTGKATAENGKIEATTNEGDILITNAAEAGQRIHLSSGSGAITVKGSATAGSQFEANAGSGTITLGGDVTANGGSVTAYTGSGNVSVSGKADASQDIDLSSDGGSISVTGDAEAGQDFSAITGGGNITLGGSITAETGKVLAQTGSGMIQVGGNVSSARNTELTAGAETGDEGTVIVNGAIDSGKEVHASTANGDILFKGATTAHGGDVTATVSGDGDITFNGAVTAVSNGESGGNIIANVAGNGDITTEKDALFNADEDVQFTTNDGDITTGSTVEAGRDIIFNAVGEGGMTIHKDLTAGQNVELNVNKGDIFFDGGKAGASGEDVKVTAETGDVTFTVNTEGDIKDTHREPNGDKAIISADNGSITVDHQGVGDVDLYELFAKEDAKISVADGDLYLGKVSGDLVAVLVKTEGKVMDVQHVEAATEIQISGSDMDLDDITQREDGDGFLVISPEGTSTDRPIDNFTIGNIKTNGGVRFEHLWLNNGNIHVSDGALHLDKIYVEDKATVSTDAMTTDIFGSAPVFDDSVSSAYWVNTGRNKPKDNQDVWQSEGVSDMYMYLYFDADGAVQYSNGNLLHLADHNYVYNQRYSQVDWMNIFTDKDFYNFYDRYYAPELSYHERYGLTSGSGHSVENAEEDEVIVE